MNEPANHWKLGLFVVLGAVLTFAAVLYLGTSSLRKETVTYTSYFDESVTGLDIGSPVRFRGVNVGHVSGIDIAPDRRNVQISYALGVSVLTNLGLAVPQGKNTKLSIPPELRAQLGSAGVTGVKYILIDFFDVAANPRPKLPFPVPGNYIPTAQSTMKNLEESVMRAVDSLPLVMTQLTEILQQANHILLDIDAKELSSKATKTLSNLDHTLANWDATLVDARKVLHGVDSPGLSAEAKTTLQSLDATLTRAQGMMTRIDGDKGVLSSVQRASDSVGDVANDARGYSSQLTDTLRDLSEAANSIRALADTLQTDSDMLLKGRAKARKP